jgi:hypothetical protein
MFDVPPLTEVLLETRTSGLEWPAFPPGVFNNENTGWGVESLSAGGFGVVWDGGTAVK